MRTTVSVVTAGVVVTGTSDVFVLMLEETVGPDVCLVVVVDGTSVTVLDGGLVVMAK